MKELNPDLKGLINDTMNEVHFKTMKAKKLKAMDLKLQKVKENKERCKSGMIILSEEQENKVKIFDKLKLGIIKKTYQQKQSKTQKYWDMIRDHYLNKKLNIDNLDLKMISGIIGLQKAFALEFVDLNLS